MSQFDIETGDIQGAAKAAWDCGETLTGLLNNLMTGLDPMLDGLKGAAGKEFQIIQGQLYEQMDRINKRMDDVGMILDTGGKKTDASDTDSAADLAKTWAPGAEAASKLSTGNA